MNKKEMIQIAKKLNPFVKWSNLKKNEVASYLKMRGVF